MIHAYFKTTKNNLLDYFLGGLLTIIDYGGGCFYDVVFTWLISSVVFLHFTDH